MPIKNETSTHFWDEISIISPVARVLACLGFVVTGAAMIAALVMNKSHDPFFRLPILTPMAFVGGCVIACYILLIGYVYADAGRRGMSRLGWTLLAIFVPNALGIVLYFVLRRPRLLHCPQCRTVVEPGFGFCPRCRAPLNAVCPLCQRSVNEADTFCPYCGGDLKSPTQAPAQRA
jgi:RNA polymerase subunit RPABC4/transcription elongation factor Spt4